ncbi:hypothetical protein KIPB_004137 [Kipferlia bialata]|uniref:Lipid-binding serum glycoprotein N-terminal domain-containing protein n=1 Tax=Kipferlia bialata TaxID=797122 RepID=A0A9K3CUV7_9EUKA|nr:hypothetical protein KIPB_004137 [Kipferlia bialata]|eukprot:g4137.t1
MPLPDISGTFDLKVASLDYSLTSMVINEVTIDAFNLNPVPPDILDVSIQNAGFSMGFHWHFKEDGFPYVEDDGTGVASISSLSASGTLKTVMDRECGNWRT